jgi:hypothetical protein
VDGALLESMRRESWDLALTQDVETAAGAVIAFLQEHTFRHKALSPAPQ